MNWKNLLINWKTMVGGILASLQPLFVGAGFTLTLPEQHWLALCSGVGLLLLGGAAKDSTTHSTPQQVAKAGEAETKI